MKTHIELRKTKDVSQQDIADYLGVSRVTISNYETGRRDPDTSTLGKLASYFNVSVDYLLGNSTQPAERPAYGAKTIHGPNWSQIIYPVKDPSRKAFRTYDVWGYIPCGAPNDLVEVPVDWENVTEDIYSRGDIFLTKAKGDSMDPEIRDGDTVILYYTQNQAWDGAICAVRINGDTGTLKKIKIHPNGLELIPLNKAYKPVVYTDKQVEEVPVTIIGVLAEVRKKYHYLKE